MTVYEYVAKDVNGVEFAGVCEDVDSVMGLRQELAKMGDTLVKAKRKKRALLKSSRIKEVEVIAFAYKFAGMCSAGLSVIQSLETLEEQSENPVFRCVLSDIKQNVETGSSLKDAFGKHKKLFSDFFLGMVEAGESNGKLADTLEMSAVYLDKRADLKLKVKAAFTYPIIVGILCLIITSCLILFVVPVFSKMYSQLHVALPGPTLVLVNLSIFIKGWWWAILATISIVIFAVRHFLKDPYFKIQWDAFKLQMPVFAKLNRMMVVSCFIRTFAMLISTGVSLLRALEIADKVANNAKVSEITKDLRESIKAGNPVASSLKKHDLFPPMIIQLAASGEQTGGLADMLNKGVEFLDKDIERTTNALLVKIEPTITLVMGLIIGFIMISVYLPMFDYMGHLK